MSDNFDVFDQLLEAQDDTEDAGRPAEVAEFESAPEAVEVRSDVCGLFVAALVAPDLQRFPVPESFFAGKVAVDLSEYDKLSAADVKKIVTETLPDEQLAYLRQLESDRDKPRAVALKAIDAELDRRGPAFSNWVNRHCENIFGCRIVAISFAWCDEEPTSITCISTEEEREALIQLSQMVAMLHGQESYSPLLLSYETRFLVRLLRLRATALGWFEQAVPFGNARPFWIDQQLPVDCASLGGGREVLAGALGLIDVPDQPSSVDVLNAVLAKNDTWLFDRVGERLMLERDMLLLAEKIYA